MNDNLEDLEIDEPDGESVLGGVAVPHPVTPDLAPTEAKVTAVADSLVAKKVPGY